MGSKSDLIEEYLLDLLRQTGSRGVEIRRVDLANLFRCVPSQINYVLQTRFTPERGFIIESRRGEGGYIRIIRMPKRSADEMLSNLVSSLNDQLDRRQVRDYLRRLYENELISRREFNIMAESLGVGRKAQSFQLTRRQRSELLKRFIQILNWLPRKAGGDEDNAL